MYETKNDDIPFRKMYVSVAILVINIVVFIIQLTDPIGYMYIDVAAFVPAEFFAGQKLWTIITSMFMHADFFHILFNMWAFYVVADNCEKAMGHILFLITYIVSGICADLMHAAITLLDPSQAIIPTLGASGAIFGIVAVYGILFPNARLGLFLGFFFVHLRAKYFVLIYFLIQLVYGILLWGFSSTAYWAHIGGFLAGATFAVIFKAFKGDSYKNSKR